MNVNVTMDCTAPRAFRRLDYGAFFDTALDQLRDESLYRVFANLERQAGRFPHAIWHSSAGPRQVVIWCSNDYLGMAQHPKVVGAMIEAARRMGTGAGGTRNIAGTNHPLIELERELASLHGKEAALVFTSGYVSNQTGIATIAKLLPDCLLLSDALNHNSMIEGVRQSGAERQIPLGKPISGRLPAHARFDGIEFADPAQRLGCHRRAGRLAAFS